MRRAVVAAALILLLAPSSAGAEQLGGRADRAVPDATANDLFAKLIRKVNRGERAQARKLANKQVVRPMFRARNQGYRFAKPMSECTQSEDQPSNLFECETALYFGDQLSGSLFVVVKESSEGFRAVRGNVSFGE